jgi:hypothetical protein
MENNHSISNFRKMAGNSGNEHKKEGASLNAAPSLHRALLLNK